MFCELGGKIETQAEREQLTGGLAVVADAAQGRRLAVAREVDGLLGVDCDDEIVGLVVCGQEARKYKT